MKTWLSIVALLSLLIFGSMARAQSTTQPVDFNHARELKQKQDRGETLTPDEQQYLDAARQQFQHGKPAGQPAPAANAPQGAAEGGSKDLLPPLPPGTKALLDLDYGGQHLAHQTLDLYVPDTAKDLPLIVWIHGGGWAYQDKVPCNALQFIARGYVVASINYRLSDEAVWPAQIYDCKGALRYLRANAKKYHIDPDHVGAWGSSAGGHLVAMLGVAGAVKDLEGTVGGNLQYSSRVQAVCDWFGPTDLSKLTDPRDTVLVNKLLGGTAAQKPAECRSASPVTYLEKSDGKDLPAFLIMHGATDVAVPPQQSEELNEALKKAGADVTYHTTPGHGHGYLAMATPPNLTMVGDFFDKHFKAAATTQPTVP